MSRRGYGRTMPLMAQRRIALIAGLAVVAGALAGGDAQAWHDRGRATKTTYRVSYTDPSGDSLSERYVPAADITAVSYEVASRGAARRPHLVIKMTLAQPPVDAIDYQTGVDATQCVAIGTAYAPPAALTVAPGKSRSNVYIGCGSRDPVTGWTGTIYPLVPEITGRTIIWSLPLDRLPARMRNGTTILYQFWAHTQPAEPVTGHIGPGAAGRAIDGAGSSVTWTLPTG